VSDDDILKALLAKRRKPVDDKAQQDRVFAAKRFEVV
jgi:hypothetical protein